MIGKLIINGEDAFTRWGVVLEKGSYGRLLSGHTMKAYTTNTSRSIDGKIVSMRNPRLQDRDVVIVFIFTQRQTPFLTRYKSFIETLRNGRVVNGKIHPIQLHVVDLDETYNLIYTADMNMENHDLQIAKVAVRFNEPNPKDRE